MFDLDKNNSTPGLDRDEYRKFKMKEHNKRQKALAKTIGENFATYSLIAIMALMVGSIWSEVGIFSNWRKFIGDALVTVVLYILADICAAYIGTGGGKLDDHYINTHNEYLSLRETVRNAGISMMNMFCDWQIDVEYEYYLRKKCKELKIDYNEYMSNYHGKTFEELKMMFPTEGPKDESFATVIHAGIRTAKVTSKAAKIFMLNQIDHIDLTPDILLTDGMVKNERGAVSISGEEYVEKHTIGKMHIAVTALIAVVAAVPVFTLAQEFTVGAVIYTIFKLALLLFRMYSGFARGAKAFCTVDPKSLQDKIKYLHLYLEFLNNKTYLKLEDKYKSSEVYYAEDNRQIKTNESGAGGYQAQLGDNQDSIRDPAP